MNVGGDCWWMFGGVPISLITNVKFDGPYMIRCVWIRVTLLLLACFQRKYRGAKYNLMFQQ